MTLPSFVGSIADAKGASTTITYTADFGVAGLTDGDTVFVVLVCDATAVVYDAATYNAETWTLIASGSALGTRSTQIFARTWHTGNSTVFNYRKNRANADGILAFVFRGGDLAHLVVGTGKNRATAPVDSGLTTTALGIASTAVDTLAIAISLEATTAAESGAFLTGPTIPSGWTQKAYRAQDALSINTIEVATKGMATAGATGDAIFTYQNSQASNGWAIQLGLPAPVTAPPASEGLSGVYVDSVGVAHSGYLFYNDVNNVRHPVALPSIIYKPYTVSAMMKSTAKAPWFSAHRGGSYNYPEETLAGYRGSAQRGVRALEISVMYSADGTPWCFHDANTLRTTGVSGTISAMTDAQLAVLANLGSTATGNPSQPSRPVAKLVDVIAQYKDTHVLIVEDKTYTHQTAFLNLLDSYGTAGRPATEIFVVKLDATTGQSFVTNAASRGYKTWGYIFDNDMALKFAATLTKGFSMIGLDYASSDTTLSDAITQLKAAGIKPTGHIVPSRTIRTRLLNLGLQGLMMSNVDAIFN